MILSIFGIILMLVGLTVSILFWIPAVFDRKKLKSVLGRRYPLVYMVYVANGPLLVLFGILLVLWQRA